MAIAENPRTFGCRIGQIQNLQSSFEKGEARQLALVEANTFRSRHDCLVDALLLIADDGIHGLAASA